MSGGDKIRVLMVDDRPEKLLSLEAVLSDLPLELVQAHSGREALRCLLNGDFAVILLDVNMPGMDGFETAQLIRQRKSSEHTPIIFVTAYQDELFMSRGYSLGAVDYVFKPFDPEILRAKVAAFVELSRKTRELQEEVLGLFGASMARFGILALGRKESIHHSTHADEYEPLVESEKIFRRRS